MGNKHFSKNEASNKLDDEKKTENKDLTEQYDAIYKAEQPCLKYFAEHPKLNVSKTFLIKFESISDQIPCISSSGFISAEIDENNICGFESSENELDQFLSTHKSFMSQIILLNIDNRWKKHKKNNNKNDDIFCCWFLRQTDIDKLGASYNLYYLQIIGNKTLLISFKLIILCQHHPKLFLISPDCNYLLIFGEGCNFIKLPNIYTDINKNKLLTINEIERYYECNMENNKNELFQFQTYPTISMAHFINDHLLICVDSYYSDIGIVPREQDLYILDLNVKENNKRLTKSSQIFGNQQQYVTSGHGLLVFSCGEYTKYAPKHLIKDKIIETKNHLWIYKINNNENVKLIGHDHRIKTRIKTNWRIMAENNASSQIIPREFEGISKDKYWLIVVAKDSAITDDILIFDIPSCILTWIIPSNRFKLSISDHCHLNVNRYWIDKYIYLCSYGIVLMRECKRNYGSNNIRKEADFALHPVPFWDHENIIKLLQPYLEYITALIDIILSYAINPSVAEAKVTSNLRYIQSNCLAVSDGFGNFVIMASYWNKQQLNRIRNALCGQFKDNHLKYKNNPNDNVKYKHLICKISWAQLLEYQYPPNKFQYNTEQNDWMQEARELKEFNYSSIKYVDEKGSYLNLCHHFLE